jgi:hypothetical protein
MTSMTSPVRSFVRLPLVALAFTLALALAAACATTSGNPYRASLDRQTSCCDGLRDQRARQACLAEIPRTQGDETSALNRETFSCVEKYFSCDPATGRATRTSAQRQLDCLSDLESTQREQGTVATSPQ